MFRDAVKYSLIHICNGNISTKWFLYRKLRMKIVLICLVLIFVCVWSFLLLYNDLNNWIRRLCMYTYVSFILTASAFLAIKFDMCFFIFIFKYILFLIYWLYICVANSVFDCLFFFTVCLGREALCSLIQYICYCWHIKLVASKSFICKFFFESHTCRCLS
jgi:hypothetical protein